MTSTVDDTTNGVDVTLDDIRTITRIQYNVTKVNLQCTYYTTYTEIKDADIKKFVEFYPNVEELRFDNQCGVTPASLKYLQELKSLTLLMVMYGTLFNGCDCFDPKLKNLKILIVHHIKKRYRNDLLKWISRHDNIECIDINTDDDE